MKSDQVHVSSLPTVSSELAPLPSTPLDRWVAERIQSALAGASIEFVLWDGVELPSRAGPPIATVIIKNRTALLRWAWDPDLNFGEAYMFGTVEVQGDLLATLESAFAARTG